MLVEELDASLPDFAASPVVDVAAGADDPELPLALDDDEEEDDSESPLLFAGLP